MDILYIGESAPWSTSRHRADALARLGHSVELWDPSTHVAGLRKSGVLQKLHNMTGQRLLVGRVHDWLQRNLQRAKRPDVVWVNGGELLSPTSVQAVKTLSAPVLLYNNDDPTGHRDGRRHTQVRRALPWYDLCVALRRQTASEMSNLGARHVLVAPFSYDERQHRPLEAAEFVRDEFRSDVTFVGTWMRGEARDQLLLDLHRAGLSVRIWGDRWEKSRNKELLDHCWRGHAIVGRDYVHAVAGAKIAIGAVSKGNRDQHTTRSVEIPYAGGLLCAERTSEHMQMFKDGEEAVFWSSPVECIQVCRALLANEDRRRDIVANGMRKVRELKVGNEDVCRRVLEELVR